MESCLPRVRVQVVHNCSELTDLEDGDPLLRVRLIAGGKIEVDLRNDLVAGSNAKLGAAFGPLQDLSRASPPPAAAALQGFDVKGSGSVGEGSVAVEVLQGLDGPVGSLDGRGEDQRLFLGNSPVNWNLRWLAVLKFRYKFS